VNGGTRIGEGTLLGSGAVCREGISIGRRCIVAMGSRAFESVPDDTIYFGEKFR
jgi:acetyltransferase-like isoleucine patch superfamily enzyme